MDIGDVAMGALVVAGFLAVFVVMIRQADRDLHKPESIRGPHPRLTEWRATARTLSIGDRRVLRRATNRGRQVPSRLAALAVQRGEMVVAVTRRELDPASDARARSFRMGLMFLLFAALRVPEVAPPHPSNLSRVTLVVFLFMSGSFFTEPWTRRRKLRRARRSVQLNRAVLEDAGTAAGQVAR